jgi:hypothetical protein
MAPARGSFPGSGSIPCGFNLSGLIAQEGTYSSTFSAGSYTHQCYYHDGTLGEVGAACYGKAAIGYRLVTSTQIVEEPLIRIPDEVITRPRPLYKPPTNTDPHPAFSPPAPKARGGEGGSYSGRGNAGRAGDDKRGPPRDRNSKERKLKGSANAVRALNALGKAFAGATEGKDALEQVWKALPASKRGKDSTPQGMAKDVWNNLEHVDAAKAAENLIQNYFEDKVIGGAQKAAQTGIEAGRSQAGVQSNIGGKLGGIGQVPF